MSPIRRTAAGLLLAALTLPDGVAAAPSRRPAPDPVQMPDAPPIDAPELSPAPMRPGPVQKWTLVQVMRAAENKHPRIVALRAERSVIDARVLTARKSIPNPLLLVDGGTAEYTYRFGLTQTVELGPKRRGRIDVASGEHAVLDAELRIVAAGLRAEARRTYMEAFFAQEREKQLITLIRGVDELLRIADARPGEIPRADVLEVRITRLKARQALEQAKFEHLDADLRLNSLLGNPPSVELELASPARERPPKWLDLNNDDWRNEFLAAYDLLIAEALRQRPELARLKSAREVVNREERLARANRAPDVVLSAGPGHVPGGTPRFGGFFVVALQLPIFDRQQGPLAEARARRARLAEEGAALEHEIARQLADAVALACFQQSQLRLYERELLPTADAIYDDALQAFLAGTTPFLVPVRAQEARVLVYLEHLRALAAYHIALAGVEQALGFPAI